MKLLSKMIAVLFVGTSLLSAHAFTALQIETCLKTAYQHWLGSLGAKLSVETPVVRFWSTGQRSPWTNIVFFNPQVTVDEIKEKVREIEASAGSLPLCVHLSSSYPEAVIAAVQEEGFALKEQYAAMVHTLEKGEAVPFDNGIEIKPLTLEDAPAWIEMIGSTYDYHQDLIDANLISVQKDISGPTTVEHYAGYYEGKLVATGSLTIQGHFAETYNETTAESVRAKGMAAAMMQHLLTRSRELGLQFVVILATADGKPLYDRLGFREVSKVYFYTKG